MEEKINILKIQRCCIHDGPGIRTTVFMKGCPLKCQWCHNPESIPSSKVLMYNKELCVSCRKCMFTCSQQVHQFKNHNHHIAYQQCEAMGRCVKACPSEALSLHGEMMSQSDVMNIIRKDVDYYNNSSGGVTLSGGEPLLQINAVLGLSEACHKEGLSVYLDTSGYASASLFQRAVNCVDGLLFDIKPMDEKVHKDYTGVSNKQIHLNFMWAVNQTIPVRMRVIIIPGLTDKAENLDAIIRLAKESGFKGPIDLMPLHHYGRGKYSQMGLQYSMVDVPLPTQNSLNNIVAYFEKEGIESTIQ